MPLAMPNNPFIGKNKENYPKSKIDDNSKNYMSNISDEIIIYKQIYCFLCWVFVESDIFSYWNW